MLFMILFNTDLLRKENRLTSYAATVITDSSKLKSREPKAIAGLHKDHKKITNREGKTLRKELARVSKLWSFRNEKAKKDHTGEIVKIILLALLATAGILFLGCAIGCAGAETVATAVAIGGLGVVIWMTIVLIRKQNKITREKSKPDLKM